MIDLRALTLFLAVRANDRGSPLEVIDTAPPQERSRQAMCRLSRNRSLLKRTERPLRSKAASRMNQAAKSDRKFLPEMLHNVL